MSLRFYSKNRSIYLRSTKLIYGEMNTLCEEKVHHVKKARKLSAFVKI